MISGMWGIVKQFMPKEFDTSETWLLHLHAKVIYLAQEWNKQETIFSKAEVKKLNKNLGLLTGIDFIQILQPSLDAILLAKCIDMPFGSIVG